ncbi:MAG TPA: hypothetical protein VM327_04485 [Candidatus Thermoplasmatota archaeon]|nr:hypothetical protein [Candidatus Thermoplasmatota archaeon]
MRLLAMLGFSLTLAGCATGPGLPVMSEATETIGPHALMSKQFLLEEDQQLEWDWTSDTAITFVARHETQGVVVQAANRLSHSGHIEGKDQPRAFWLDWTTPESNGASIHIVFRGITAKPATTISDP